MALMGLDPQNEIASVANHEHQHVEHEHNFVIDFESDEWKNADAEGKMLYFMTQGAKQNFTEEAWNKLSDFQKNIERDKFLNEEFSVHNSEWESADETKKLKIISEFLNDYMLAEDLKMTLPELFAFKTNSPDEYAKKQKNFFNNNKKIDLVAEKEKAKYEFVQQRENAEKNYNDTLSEFLKNHNITKEEFLENKELILKFNAQYTDTVENNSKSKFDKYQAKNEQYKQLIDTFLSEKGLQKKDYFNNLQLQLDYYEYYKNKYGENAIPPSQKENIAVINKLKEVNGNDLAGIGGGSQSFSEIIKPEDALEVLNIANQLINNSETISDEMKQFYVQNTVESLLTEEQRNAQIENLRTYDNEYFNTGIKDGLNNIANQTSSSSEGSTSQSVQYGDYSYNNPL